MKNLIYTDHARERMFLRGISKSSVSLAMEKYDETEREDDGDLKFIKQVKRRNNQHRDLHVVAKQLHDQGNETWLIKTVWIRGENDPNFFIKTIKMLLMRLLFKKGSQR